MRGRSGYPKQEEQFGKMVWEEGTEHSADEWRLPSSGLQAETAVTVAVTERSRAPAAEQPRSPPPFRQSSVTPLAKMMKARSLLQNEA